MFGITAKRASFWAAGIVALGVSGTASAQGVDLPLGELTSSVDSGWTIGRGARGDAVRDLQRSLQRLGYSVSVDGVFGGGTDRALKSFQRANGLRADGLVGENTLRALNAAVTARSAPSAPAASAPVTTSAPARTSSVGARGALAGERPSGASSSSDAATARSAGTLRRGNKGPAVSALQRMLRAAGYPVSVDGDFGSGTRNALRSFQRANGLSADGIAGPATFSALEGGSSVGGSMGGSAPAASTPRGNASWMAIARSQMGVREYSGSSNNPRIVEYHVAGGAGRAPDSTAWCSSFVNWVMKRAGLGGTSRANARSWLSYGQRLSRPREGCIVVFWRGSRNGWQGHVGFYVGETSTHIKVLGGNQSNAVNISNYPKSRVLGYRWPSGR